MTAVRDLVAVGAVGQARAGRRPASPAALARQLDPKFVMTPTIALLSDLAVRSVTQPNQRDAVSCCPRTGKSQLLAIWTPVWALMRDPDTEIMIITGSDGLAERHSREVRRIIDAHSDYLGFALRRDQRNVNDWGVEGHKGGVLAAGIGSGIIGRGSTLIILDDVIRNQSDADSVAVRRRTSNEFRSTVSSRLEPGGSVFLVMSRWHQDDIVGEMIADEPDVWRQTNVPAVSEAGVPDALGRAPGVAMTTTLGYSADDFAAKRRSVGERAWYAMYQGVPSSPAGGLVQKLWFDQHRIPAAPPHPIRTVVAVDPADSGERDAAGIVAASLGSDGKVSIIADATGKMTSEEWANAAIDLAVGVGASEIHVEAFASGFTFVKVIRDALARRGITRPISVKGWPPKGTPRRGDAVARASGLLQALEVGTARLAGRFLDLEAAAIQWQAGQHQPDALAAAVIAHDVLAPIAGQRWTFTPPNLTAKITDRPGLDANGFPGQRQPSTAAVAQLTRNVHGTGYNALAYPTRTIR